MSNSLPLSPHGVVMLSPHGVKGTRAQIGQVLALHPLYGHAPYGVWEQNGSSDDPWAAGMGNWLRGSGGGSEPSTDACASTYYLTLEMKVKLSWNGGADSEVYSDVVTLGKHSGVIVLRVTKALDKITGDYRSETYTLGTDGSESGDGTISWADTPYAAVQKAVGMWWPAGYTDGSDSYSASLGATVGKYAYSASATGPSLPDVSYVATYTYTLSDPWGSGDVQGALDTLLSQINLSNPAQKYHIYEDATRAVLSYRALNPAGESVTVTYDGLSDGVPLAVVIISNGVWNWSPPQWMAANMNDATYCIVNGVLPPYGEAGVPGAIGDADSNDASGLVGSGRPWAKIKSMVLIPAGSFTKTIFSYQQPQADTVGYTAYHAGTPLNNYPGAELLGSPTYAITGGNWYYFSPGPWISLTKAS